MSDSTPPSGEPNASTLAASLAAKLIDEFGVRHRERVVIAVAGESGSGKTVTATELRRAFDRAGVATGILHQDDYFNLPPRTNHEHRLLDLANVGPHEVNLALLQSHVDAFLAGRAMVDGPAVDYPANRFVTQQHDFSKLDALIVDGTYVFRLRGIDVRIFLEATHEETRERRRKRNRDIEAPVIEQILRIEHEIIAPCVREADVVIGSDWVVRDG